MKKILKSLLFTAVVVALAISVFPAAAQIAPLKGDQCAGLECEGGIDGIIEIATNIINGFLVLVGLVAAAALIYGGVMYIVSGGNEEKTATAKRIILFAIVGLIVIGLSAAVVNLVIGLISGDGNVGGEGQGFE